MWHTLFMATVDKESSLGDKPKAELVVSINAVNLYKPRNFSSHPCLLGVPQAFLSRVPLCTKSYQRETDWFSSQFPYELLFFCVAIMIKCVLSLRCVEAGRKLRIPIESIKSFYPEKFLSKLHLSSKFLHCPALSHEMS